MARALGWRVCPHVSRRVFPVNSPVSHGIDADELRDWTGSSTLIDAYPKYVAGTCVKGNEGDQPYAGWHWGNCGAVTSAAIEKPHRSGWRPLLECEFDLAYTPLMELDYGQGRLIVCTLDLEDHVALDPAARRMAGRIMDYAFHSPLSPRVNKVVYLGGEAGAAWLERIGVSYQRSATLYTGAGLVLVGPDRFQADKKTCFRYTRWRSTRAVAQRLANLGASFVVDSQVFRPLGASGYYHPDYRTDFPMGDNPYRYYRW